MAGNRRDFFKTSAAVGLLGTAASQASADFTTDKWVALMHTTALDPDLEQALLDGLSTKNYEADPTKKVSGGATRVVIERFHGRGKYGQGHAGEFDNLTDSISSQNPPWKLIISAGGNPAAISASSKFNQIPLLVAYVPQPTNNPVPSNQYARAFDLSKDSTNTYTDPTGTIVSKLQGSYGVTPNSQIVLLHNGNSKASDTYINNWSSAAPGSKKSDASAGSRNESIDFMKAISRALAPTDSTKKRAIAITPDPYFTHRRRDIIDALRPLANLNLVICFPFTEYYDEAKKHNEFSESNCIVVGPSLTEVYNLLGQKAGDMLTTAITPVFSASGVPFYYSGLP